jgi:xanthine dehydrogenase small subunit
MRDYLLFYVNGIRHQISGTRGFQALADFLRGDLGLVGTKVVCAEGDCGSCTVLIGRVRNSVMCYEGINSCIQYLYQLDCAHVITVEGLNGGAEKIHPVQKAMVDAFGSQCGYCTPGFVMSLAAMLETQEVMTRSSVQEGLTGNLCRCTGYEQIIDAGLSLNKKNIPKPSKRFNEDAMLADFSEHVSQAVSCEYEEKWNGSSQKVQFYVPTTLAEALEFKQQNQQVTIIAGGTDISVQLNKEQIEPNCIMSLTHLTGLESFEINNKTITVGAKLSWSKLAEHCQLHLPQFAEIIEIFASRQIKNAATLAGNIANASPIADSLPFLYVIDAEIELSRSQPDGSLGKRWVKINQFYHGYKKTEMNADELITKIRWNLPETDDVLKLYKVSKRKDLDISTFTAGIWLKLKKGKIQNARLAYGGVGPVVLRLPETEEYLHEKPLLQEIFQQAGKIARNEISPISDVRSSSVYRSQLAENILLKFFHECCDSRNKKEAA